ncbi:MAG: hypothetical protein H6983_10520 [Ectothiorhodospiraceae bacterium]|nr:hypothetical protein [Chromatiales bacterium]MCP5154590.1 hypothetical protein [Ectothiorhodospiraceae bacterium]
MSNVLHVLGSPKLTPLGILALAAAVAVTYRVPAAPGWLMLPPLAALTANLLAALVIHPRLRREASLLVFHLALLAVLALATIGRLVETEGRAEVLTGAAFDPAAVSLVRAGPFGGQERLAGADFVQEGFVVHYRAGMVRGATASTVTTVGGERVTFGDTTPLTVGGHRFYTTPNKGYAALVTWLPNASPAESGAVHFPSYPLRDWKQENTIHPSGSAPVRLRLDLPGPPPGAGPWVLDSATVPSGTRLVVAAGTIEATLAPGESVELPAGRLRFDAPRMWIGYRVTFDPTLPWLLGAAAVGVVAIALHFLGLGAARVRRARGTGAASMRAGQHA